MAKIILRTATIDDVQCWLRNNFHRQHSYEFVNNFMRAVVESGRLDIMKLLMSDDAAIKNMMHMRDSILYSNMFAESHVEIIKYLFVDIDYSTTFYLEIHNVNNINNVNFPDLEYQNIVYEDVTYGSFKLIDRLIECTKEQQPYFSEALPDIMCIAVSFGIIEILDVMLLYRDSIVYNKSKHDTDILHNVIRNNCHEAIISESIVRISYENSLKLLLSRCTGVDINELDDNEETLLYTAIRRGDVIAVKLLLDKSPDLTIGSKNNPSILYYVDSLSIYSENNNKIRYLVKNYSMAVCMSLYYNLDKWLHVDVLRHVIQYILPLEKEDILATCNAISVLDRFTLANRYYKAQKQYNKAIIAMARNNSSNVNRAVASLQKNNYINSASNMLTSLKGYLKFNKQQNLLNAYNSRLTSANINRLIAKSGGRDKCNIAIDKLKQEILFFNKRQKQEEQEISKIVISLTDRESCKLFQSSYKDNFASDNNFWDQQLFSMRKSLKKSLNANWHIPNWGMGYNKYTIEHRKDAAKKITVARTGNKISISAAVGSLDSMMLMIIAAQAKQKADLLNTKTININCSNVFYKSRLCKILQALLQQLDPKFKLVMNGVINAPRI
ncbi:MAG: hypothetical protein COC15_05090 [Legionellales bacterium]|nr:MAG: hypothetical protein COC15_05090 [Legionellales bacterium]